MGQFHEADGEACRTVNNTMKYLYQDWGTFTLTIKKRKFCVVVKTESMRHADMYGYKTDVKSHQHWTLIDLLSRTEQSGAWYPLWHMYHVTQWTAWSVRLECKNESVQSFRQYMYKDNSRITCIFCLVNSNQLSYVHCWYGTSSSYASFPLAMFTNFSAADHMWYAFVF